MNQSKLSIALLVFSVLYPPENIFSQLTKLPPGIMIVMSIFSFAQIPPKKLIHTNLFTGQHHKIRCSMIQKG